MDAGADFCEHCQGQRFDRAQVLRALRRLRNDLRGKPRRKDLEAALALALKTIAALEIPHLDIEEGSGEVVH
jgi:hypothetical protein